MQNSAKKWWEEAVTLASDLREYRRCCHPGEAVTRLVRIPDGVSCGIECPKCHNEWLTDSPTWYCRECRSAVGERDDIIHCYCGWEGRMPDLSVVADEDPVRPGQRIPHNQVGYDMTLIGGRSEPETRDMDLLGGTRTVFRGEQCTILVHRGGEPSCCEYGELGEVVCPRCYRIISPGEDNLLEAEEVMQCAECGALVDISQLMDPARLARLLDDDHQPGATQRDDGSHSAFPTSLVGG